jgi:flagellar basal-body rod modification protein FlgD
MVASISDVAAASGTGQTRTSAKTLADNYQTFLTLLTTQLRNQNPLEPMNANEFTQQLVQFSSVEQQLKTNDTLSSLLSMVKGFNVTNALNFVGATVTADGSMAKFSGGRAEWKLETPRAAREATIEIRDRTGAVVFSETKALPAGSQTYSWDGRTTTGGTALEGDYTIAIKAVDTANAQMVVKTEISGQVTGVDVSGATPILQIGSIQIAMDKVKSVRR